MRKHKKGAVIQLGGMALIFLLVAAVGLTWFFKPDLFKSGESLAIGDTSVDAGDLGAGACPESTATVSFSAVNALSKGTAVTTGQKVIVDGGQSAAATTSYPVGSQLEILWNATNYIDKTTTYNVACGGGVIPAEIYATDDVTIRMFNTNGDIMTTAVYTTNQTAIAAGGKANIEVKMDGNDKQSSGDLLCVLEHTNTTAVDSLTLSGLGGASKAANVPDFYSVSSAGSKAYAYNVPAIVGAETVSGTLGVQMKTGKQYPGQSITMTCYSKQAFEDVDGSFDKGVENTDGTEKYEDTFNFVFKVGY